MSTQGPGEGVSSDRGTPEREEYRPKVPEKRTINSQGLLFVHPGKIKF